ncbi:MAG: hypothetical protein QXJ27_00205 [Thermoplasmata archaeon]
MAIPGRIGKWNSVIESEKRVLGRFIVVTDIKEESYKNIIENYKGLQKIGQGFRVLKSEFSSGQCTIAPKGGLLITQCLCIMGKPY